MTYFDQRSETDLKHGYGYGHLNRLSFELAPDWYESLQSREWQRVFEVMQGAFEPAGPAAECGCCGCLMTPEEIEFFNGGAREGFRYIALRHGLQPTEMWDLVENGMRSLGIHDDDLDDLQSYCFGWTELTSQAMHRWALRYPKRCPLLDVLCSLDQTHEQLNAVQDWLLSTKGSYGRTRNDVLPALPEPDGIRPHIEPKLPTAPEL